MLPTTTIFTARDAREIKKTGKSIRRSFKTLAACEAHMKANGLDPAVTLCVDIPYTADGKVRTKRLHSIKDAEAFVAANAEAVAQAAVKPAKAVKADEPAPQAAHNAPEPAAMAQVPAAAAAPATAPEPEDKPALTLVGGTDGGHGFSTQAQKARRAPRPENLVAGISKNEAKNERARIARAAKKAAASAS